MNLWRSLIVASALLLAPPSLACDRAGLFGSGWLDLDGDGRDSRQGMLDNSDRGGWWLGQYDGVIIEESSAADVDHVVPLCLAAEWGADEWHAELRIQFANDPLNLLVVSAGANRSKGARPPSAWMPRNTAFWGPYIAQMNAVLEKYPLDVPEGERAALDCYQAFVRASGKGFRPDRWRC